MNISDIVISCFMAGFVAVLGVFPPISLFFCPTPVTLQSFGVMLAGCLLGAKKGGLALLIFLGMLSVGIPVLSLLGGIGLFFTPYGGYFLCWPLAAFCIGLLTEKNWAKMTFFKMLLINFIGGILIIYLFGIPWMAMFGKMRIVNSFYLSLTLLPVDLFKVFLASWIGMTFKKYYPLIKNPDETSFKSVVIHD